MKILRNALYLGAMQVSNILLALVVTPYITRVFGSELLGINSFGLSVATNFAILGVFGISLYGVREVSKVREDKPRLQETFSYALTFQLLFSFFASLFFILWCFTTTDGYRGYYLLFLFHIFGSATDLTWFYSGLEHFERVALRTVTMRILGSVLIFITIRSNSQLALLIILQQATILLSNLFYWVSLRRYGVRPILKNIKATLLRLFRPCLLLFIPIVFTTLLLTTDRILLGYLSTKSEVGLYDYTARLVRIAVIMVSVLGNVLLPRFSYLWNKGMYDEFFTFFKRQLFFSLFFCGLLVGLFAINAKEICELLLGDSFRGASHLLQIMILTLPLTGLSLYHTGMALGREKKIIIALIIATLFNILLNLLLIPNLESQGTAISYIFTELVLQTFYIFILRDILPFRHLLKNGLKLLLIGASAALVYLLKIENAFLSLVVRSIVFGSIYGLLGYFIFSEIKEVLSPLLRRLHIIHRK